MSNRIVKEITHLEKELAELHEPGVNFEVDGGRWQNVATDGKTLLSHNETFTSYAWSDHMNSISAA